MRNFKKISAVVVALSITLTTLVPAFAATYTTVNGDKAVVLNKLELYAGTSTSSFVPSLETELTRVQGATLLSKLFNMDDAALALTDAQADAVLKKFADASKVTSEAARKRLAYLVQNNIMSGSLESGKLYINADKSLLGGQFATLLLKQMGFTVPTWSEAIAQLSSVEGSKDVATYVSYAKGALLRDQAVGIMYGSLTAQYADGLATIIEKIVAAKPQLAAAATEAGLYTAPVVSKALDVNSAAALNSKLVEVTLNTAATAADVAATTFAVKDSAGKAINVVSAAIAAYDTDNKTVLVTLEADTTAGTLYTLTSGTKSVNFGGKAADTTKPTATVASTDYNEVTVTFSEAIKLETAKVTIAQKYGDKAALATTAVRYDGANKLVFTTADQADATLYAVTVENAADFAGNVMTKDESLTFVGQAKSTADQVVKAVKALDYKTVYVEFNVNVDPATIAAANFTMAEMYGTKATIAIADAKAPTAAQTALYDVANNTDALKAAAAKKAVVLTLTGEVKAATLYKLAVANVKTLYGKALSTTEADTYKTFTGVSKPAADSLTYTAVASSNTEVTLTFANNLDKATAENLANYSIAKVYGDKAALTITKAVQNVDNLKEVKLTVSAMTVDMYKVTATNIKDIYGNSIYTTSDANLQNFAGKAVAAKITSITAADAVAPSTGKVTVTFGGVAYGDGALDVANYTLDNGIGYPTKVAAITGSTTSVELTVPKTEIGKVYKLTVKNVKNSDGVAMDTAGASTTFVGNDEAATAPKLENAVAVNDKTIKLYFSKAIKDISDLDTTSASALAAEFVLTGATAQPDKAIVDETNDHVVILYTATADGFENVAGSTMTVTTPNATLATDYDSIVVAENVTAPTDIKIEGIAATSSKTLTVYFNQPIRVLTATANTTADEFAFVDFNANGVYNAGVDGEIVATRAINTDKTQWEVRLDTATPANASYNLVLNTGATVGTISNVDATTRTAGVYATTTSVAFAGTTSLTAYIKDVYAVATDARTLVVYFPEAMDEASVENVANYAVTTGSVIDSVYDSTNYTATLKLSADVTTASDNLVITNGTITNAIGNKQVETELGADLSVAFARNTATPAKLAIKSVSVSGSAITVVFNQKFTTGVTVDTSNVLTALDIKVNKVNNVGTPVSAVSSVVTKLGTGSAVDSATNFVDTFVITVSTPATLTPNLQGSVDFTSTVAPVLTSITGQIHDVDADAIVFAQ